MLRKPAPSILLIPLLIGVCSLLPASELGEGFWELVHPWPYSYGSRMNSIAAGNGVVVVGGDSVASSEDGVVFRVASDISHVVSLIFTGSEFVAAVNEPPRLCFSFDGRAWDCHVLPRPTGVYYGARVLGGGAEPSLVVAGYANNGMWTSVREDLGVWSSQFSGLDLAPWDLCWGDGSFVVVGDLGNSGGSGRIASSSDGIRWRSADVPASGEAIHDVEWCEGLFFAMGRSTLWSSKNGQTWSALGERPIDLRPGRMTALVCDEGSLRVFGGESDWEGGWVATLGNDGSWTFVDLEVHDVVAATVVDQRLVAVATPSSDQIVAETLPGQWRYLASRAFPRSPISVATDGERMLAVSVELRTSTTGTEWISRGFVDGALGQVQWSGDRWLLFTYESLKYSMDGENWHELPVPLEKIKYHTQLASHDEHLIVIGTTERVISAAESHVLVSADGRSWTDVEIPGLSLPGDVCWTGSEYVLVATDGFVATSAGGLAWESQQLDSRLDLTHVANNNGITVAAAADGGVVSSDDLVNWNHILPMGIDGMVWKHLLWAGGRFVLYGEGPWQSGSRSKWMYESTDGVSWESMPDPGYGLSAMVAKGVELLAFSNANTVHRYVRSSERANPKDHHLLPVAVHADGENGSLWRSDLHILSLHDEFLPVWIGGGSGAYQTAPDWAYFQIPQDGQMWREDLLAGTFPYHPPAAPIRIAADGSLLASSRVWTDGESGRYGQRVPVVQNADLVEPGDEVVLPMLAGGDAFRTNLGFSNFGEHSLAVDFQLFSAAGDRLGDLRLEADAGGWTQCTRALEAVGHAGEAVAYAVVRSFDPEARFFPYASVVDERSNDPSFIAPLRATGETMLIPAAAHSAGAAGTRWRTDLDLVNPGTSEAQLRLQLLSFDVPLEHELSLEAGSAMRIEDVVSELFAMEGSVALRLELLRGEVAAASRTYTESTQGSFGQTVPALAIDQGLPLAGMGVLAGLEQSEEFRSNLGLVNTSETPRDIVVQLFHGDGTLIGTLTPTVAPRSLLQLNQPFAQFIDLPIRGYCRVTTTEPGVFAWASVIDQRSGDPVFYPAVAVHSQP